MSQLRAGLDSDLSQSTAGQGGAGPACLRGFWPTVTAAAGSAMLDRHLRQGAEQGGGKEVLTTATTTTQ